MMKNTQSKTVLVGLSGGIDSAVAAQLLLNAHFNVIGVHLRLWQESKTIFNKEKHKLKK